MALKDAFRLSDRSEIQFGVPLEQQFEVGFKMLCRLGSQGLKPSPLDSRCDVGCRHRAMDSRISRGFQARTALTKSAKMVFETGVVSKVRSGCHWTPRTKCSPRCSMASTVPSVAVAI